MVKIPRGPTGAVGGKLGAIAGVLRAPRYAAVAAGGAAGFGALYYALTMSMLAQHAGAAYAAAPHHLAASVGLTAAVSALAGINLAVIAARVARSRAGAARSGPAVLGGAFAAFTPGCPACTATVAAVLGVAGGISLLPLQGLELKALSAGALLFSVYWAARGLQGCAGGRGPAADGACCSEPAGGQRSIAKDSACCSKPAPE